MRFLPYLNFDGNCREAFEFYAKTLGARLELMEVAGSPAEEHVPASAKHDILHAELNLKDQTILMASDTCGMPFEKAQGMHVCIVLDDTAEAERIFTALADRGRVTMPFEKTFWAERFGMCVDRFGTPWMINAGMPVEAATGTPAGTAAK
jgi:PhnB protein